MVVIGASIRVASPVPRTVTGATPPPAMVETSGYREGGGLVRIWKRKCVVVLGLWMSGEGEVVEKWW